jgi:hypothetical protein
VPPVLSSKDRLIKEPKDFTCCEEVGLRISFNVLSCANKEYLSNIIKKKNWWNMLKWVTRGHCNRAAVSRNRYGVEKTVDTHIK